MAEGFAVLVGAGPGDPGLFTLKGKACLEKADVVIYDNLISTAILDFAKPEAECIYVGKKGGCHTIPQTEITALLVAKAQEGKYVVRLKGGDPFIFGRGGEEADALVAENIPFEIVPGVTSAIAAPAYAGIPLSHRDYTSTISFITGTESHGKKKSNLYWEKISNGIGTLVVLMGLKSIREISKKLIQHGRPPETPVAVIHWGTTPNQHTITGRLDTIADRVQEEQMRPPGVIVIGDVVGLREKLSWFEKRPLLNRRILITRTKEQAAPFIAQLEQKGGVAETFPTIATVPPESWDSLDACLDTISSYDWILFTSANAVQFFMERLHERGKDIRDLKGLQICAIGSKTAGLVEALGIKVDVVPEKFIAESVIDSLKQYPLSGKRFFMPRAKEAREVIPEELAKQGATLDVGVAYQTVVPEGKGKELEELLRGGSIDVITFTSSSTVTNFLQLLSDDCRKYLKNVVIASIGPVTAKTVEQAGLKSAIISKKSTIESMTQGIVDYFSEKESR